MLQTHSPLVLDTSTREMWGFRKETERNSYFTVKSDLGNVHNNEPASAKKLFYKRKTEKLVECAFFFLKGMAGCPYEYYISTKNVCIFLNLLSDTPR